MQIDITAEFEIEKEALESLPFSGEEYSCPDSKGATQRGALGPFGILILADKNLSEQTPVYFYIIKTFNGRFKTFFCTDLTRSVFRTNILLFWILIVLDHFFFFCCEHERFLIWLMIWCMQVICSTWCCQRHIWWNSSSSQRWKIIHENSGN